MQLKCWTLDFCHFFFRRMDYWLRSWYFNWFFSSVIYVAYGKQFFFLRCICCNWEQVYYCDVFFVSMLLFFHFGLFMHACVCTLFIFWYLDFSPFWLDSMWFWIMTIWIIFWLWLIYDLLMFGYDLWLIFVHFIILSNIDSHELWLFDVAKGGEKWGGREA